MKQDVRKAGMPCLLLPALRVHLTQVTSASGMPCCSVEKHAAASYQTPGASHTINSNFFPHGFRFVPFSPKGVLVVVIAPLELNDRGIPDVNHKKTHVGRCTQTEPNEKLPSTGTVRTQTLLPFLALPDFELDIRIKPRTYQASNL